MILQSESINTTVYIYAYSYASRCSASSALNGYVLHKSTHSLNDTNNFLTAVHKKNWLTTNIMPNTSCLQRTAIASYKTGVLGKVG